MKLTLLPRRCIYRIADRVPTKGKLEAAGFLPLLALFCLTKLGFACEALALSSHGKQAVLQWHFVAFGPERDPLCDKSIGAEAELTS